jgi:hypothetical protein
MRRVLLFCLVAAMVFAAGSASAQWSLGMRLVGTGNYFPYLPLMQAMGEDAGMIVADAGIFGYKEFAVGYRADKLCFEGSFSYDKFGSTFTDPDGDEYENNLTWWYAGGTVLYNFMQGENYSGGAGVRFQYGASEVTMSLDPDVGNDEEYVMTGNMTQFSVPIRFMWRPGGGKFAIGPEIAFKYTSGTTEYEQSMGGQSQSMDGPEYSGFDTEYSLMMKFMF